MELLKKISQAAELLLTVALTAAFLSLSLYIISLLIPRL
jgi:hypothetical protein